MPFAILESEVRVKILPWRQFQFKTIITGELIQFRYKQDFNDFWYYFSIIRDCINILIHIYETFHYPVLTISFQEGFVCFYFFCKQLEKFLFSHISHKWWFTIQQFVDLQKINVIASFPDFDSLFFLVFCNILIIEKYRKFHFICSGNRVFWYDFR